ncbi:unnamed protein product [Adineta steineri]|uniref:N-acetyltransferase domain-containing protein n=1 Tax=Adineta steineri TaxID=433720 RepID=A0A815QWU2_9BILA|nr:unnamed protein product [Adineta steineri]CAF3916655.1 unnamed protein product [Adineta steineri]
MANTSISRQGQIFDDHSNANIHLYFASYNDIDDLYNVINWAYRGKPSAVSPEEVYSGWISEQHLLTGNRITPDELRELIADEQNTVILVAKLNTSSESKIVGCCKVVTCDKNLQIDDEEKDDTAVEFGLYAVDPDYQSQGIGTLLFNGAIRIAKEYFNAQRMYALILSIKQNQLEWHLRQGFIDTKRVLPFPFSERYKAIVDPDKIKFLVLTKRL